MNQNAERSPNKLISEKSPYLLQHAFNPVDWYPWSGNAFNMAAKLNKPIFLSIGYSTCHWCHVMENESFEDEYVASLLNEHFISIKVDREERPDIDNIYMKVCQMVTGRGGWPLTILMTPDKKPFYAGTYFPKESKFGRIGIIDLLTQTNNLWVNKPEEILRATGEIFNGILRISENKNSGEIDHSIFSKAFSELQNQYDDIHGGFGSQPKFPIPHNLFFLLRQCRKGFSEDAYPIVEKTLEAMHKGGIYDHIGYGFHRYSTDREWLLPHFEKMLYDQALVAMVYTEAYQYSKNVLFKNIAEEIYEYVLRDMTSHQGGFFSAEDADSEGVEGKFYTLSSGELKHVLDKNDADLFMLTYNISEEGNFIDETAHEKSGLNIPHITKSISEIAKEHHYNNQLLIDKLSVIKKKLFHYRETRVHPLKDEKILTDWNGLMIASLAKASVVFGNQKLQDAAVVSAEFILRNMITKDGLLLHRYKDGSTEINANADDYAFCTWGLLELYESTFDSKYLEAAVSLTEKFILHFWDNVDGGFYFTPDFGEKLLVRSKEIYDGAVPSANSVALSNLIKLSRITALTKYEDYAHMISKAFAGDISRMPSVYTQFLCGYDYSTSPSIEILVAGKRDSKDTKEMISAINSCFIPNKIVLFLPADENNNSIYKLAPYTKKYKMLDGKATAFVCRDYECSIPTTDISVMMELLK